MTLRASLAACLALFGPAAVAAPPPVASFTNFAEYESMKISPNGTYLAFTRRTREYELMSVVHVEGLKPASHVNFGNLTDIESFEWANDSRLLIEPARRFPGFISFKVPTGELFALDAEGNDAELLFGYQAGVPRPGSKIAQRESINAAGEVIGRSPGKPEEVLIQTYGYGTDGTVSAVYRMNVNTGRLKKLAGSPLRDGTFQLDVDHRVALVSGVDRNGDNRVFHRPDESDRWKLVVSSALGDAMLWPVASSGQTGTFYALDDRDASTRGVFAWSPGSGEQRLLYRNPEVDVGLEGVDPAGKAWAFRFDDHIPAYWYPDPEHPLARLHQWMCNTYPGHEIEITSQTDDLSLAVARISGPRTPPVFFVMDVASRKRLYLLVSRPQLDPESLATVEPIEYVARDGLKIRGYLTTPRGQQTKRLPTIVLVHGGPHGVYDSYGFDYEAQLFASRGYAVLQVNYRGSGGRGRSFAAAGFGRWGREMQDDITDGVRWAIGDGVADPKRICIYGGSYGAYAALTGAFREPEMFRCAVGMAGIYDLPLLFEKGDIQSIERGVNYLKLAVGTDEQELRRRSPAYNADKIRVPVLLMHGKVDERAPYAHATRMRDALEKSGNSPEWSTEWGEGHGFSDEANRVAAYELMLRFFAKHLADADGA